MAMRYVAPALLAIAFGIEEAIIVVYLRLLPASAGNHVYTLEILRELCTLMVIGAIAWLAGVSASSRARAFCFVFGVWDIVYYLGLWLLSGYPRLTQTDVLFLIPVPWIAPVWAPMTFALILVLIGLFGLARQRSALLMCGFILALLSFVYESAFRTTAYPVWLFVLALGLALAGLPGIYGRGMLGTRGNPMTGTR